VFQVGWVLEMKGFFHASHAILGTVYLLNQAFNLRPGFRGTKATPRFQLFNKGIAA
jgi:hypothetical protein